MQADFRKIKYCVKVMMGSMVAKILVGALMIGILQSLGSSLNLILNTLLGIFVLKDDESIGQIYTWLMTHCFQSCGPMCQGGLSCLLPFVLCNGITVVMDVLLGPTLVIIYKEVPLLCDFSKWPSALEWVANLVFTASSALALVAQGAGAYFGWQAYKVASGQIGGASDAPYMPLGAGQQLGRSAPAASSSSSASRPDGGYRPPTLSQAPRQEAFRPFSGQGNRLGG